MVRIANVKDTTSNVENGIGMNVLKPEAACRHAHYVPERPIYVTRIAAFIEDAFSFSIRAIAILANFVYPGVSISSEVL